MQIKLTTDYAIKILSCLLIHKNSGYLSSPELGDMLDISSNYILKIMKVLSKEKLVIVGVGKYGGFRINPAKESIYLYDIIEIMEPTIKINNCLESKPKQNCSFEEQHYIKEYWQTVQVHLNEILSITLEDLIKARTFEEEKLEARRWRKNV